MCMSVKENGVFLKGLDDLTQSIALYFRTPKGSICLHPELGFGIFDHVDRNIEVFLDIIREVRTGMALWDKRIEVLQAIPSFEEKGKLKLSVIWRPVENISEPIQNDFFI